MLNYRNNANFYTDARQFIIGSEGFKNGTIYPDSVSIPTVGYGYALLVKRQDGTYVKYDKIVSDFSHIDLALTESQVNSINIIAEKLNNHDTAGARSLIATLDAEVRNLTTTEADTLFQLSFDRALTQVENKFKTFLGAANGHQLFTSLAGSTEMIAIASLGYNSPGLIGKNLTTALWNGDRAEAWYEIRYGSNNGASRNQGIANRRYRESDTFGLNDDAIIPTLDDAKQTYRMFTLHREDILKYENTFSPTNINANSTAISDQLGAACVTLLADLAYNTNPDIANAYAAWEAAGNSAATFLSTNLYLNPGRGNAVNARQYTVSGSEIVSNDILIGESGVNISSGDMLIGGMGDDLLIGGTGNDYLIGGEGNDIMAGGAGDDTYFLLAGGGIDTIEDKAGNNRVIFNDKAIGTFYRLTDGLTYMSYDGSFSAVFQDGDFIVADLVTGDKVILNENFQSGDFGIILSDAPIATQPTLTIVGDLAPLDQDPASAGIKPGYDSLNNIITDPNQPEANRADTLYDSAGNDRLQGLGGQDVLDALRGGDDILEGGGDSDVLTGGSGVDQLFGELQKTLAQAQAQGEIQVATGQRGDWLSGGDGADELVGEGGNDLILGGKDEDLIYGGGGDDNIYGDADGYANRNWAVTREQSTNNNDTTYATSFSNANVDDTGLGAADILYGGAGNDWIYGNQGNDVINAGIGDDVVFGGVGQDIILGLAGNDKLAGNAGSDSPQGDGGDYIDGGEGDDVLLGGGGDDMLLGGSGNDEVTGDGNGTPGGEEGNDTLDGGEG